MKSSFSNYYKYKKTEFNQVEAESLGVPVVTTKTINQDLVYCVHKNSFASNEKLAKECSSFSVVLGFKT